MSSVLIRVNPETKKILDELKEGKKVKGRKYYSRQMKYDDLILLLLGYKNKCIALDHISILLSGMDRDFFTPDIRKSVYSFIRYLKEVKPTLSNKYECYNLDLCEKVLAALSDFDK